MSSRRHGFTIIELTMAVAFVSILLIAILLLTITAGKMYVKGDTNKSINQSGRDISSTMRQDFLSTSMSEVVTPPNKVVGASAPTEYSGRICLGSVVYLWNTAALINDTSAAATPAKITWQSGSSPIRFVRINHPSQNYCNAASLIMTIPASETAVELLGSQNGRDYALYAMTTKPVISNGNSGVYELKYTIGTNEANTTQLSAGANPYVQCKPNGNSTADFDYCSVNDFDMMVRVGGSQQ